tara:strand:+ start:337 stop:540 length:204 start_codon:yes stop_codon:yes gene_type:complete
MAESLENLDAPLIPETDPEWINRLAAIETKIDHLNDTMNLIIKGLNNPEAPEYVIDVKGDITLRPKE